MYLLLDQHTPTPRYLTAHVMTSDHHTIEVTHTHHQCMGLIMNIGCHGNKLEDLGCCKIFFYTVSIYSRYGTG